MKHLAIIFTILLILQSGHSLKSQTAELPFYYEQVSIDFGLNNGKELTDRMKEYSNFFYYYKTKQVFLTIFHPLIYLYAICIYLWCI